MPYPEALVQPMRFELTRLGVEELLHAEDVDAAFEQAEDGTMLLVINSVCGCAAANARPAVALARQYNVQPDRMVTVFAGQDLEATSRAREMLVGIPPSSPFMALFKNGDPVYIIERRHIEGRSANAIATDLIHAFGKYCGTEATAEEGPESPEVVRMSTMTHDLPPTFRSIL
ncbi:MAG: BrxA/BrxB family bacilliredoxin [Rhodothermales bacterium]